MSLLLRSGRSSALGRRQISISVPSSVLKPVLVDVGDSNVNEIRTHSSVPNTITVGEFVESSSVPQIYRQRELKAETSHVNFVRARKQEAIEVSEAELELGEKIRSQLLRNQANLSQLIYDLDETLNGSESLLVQGVFSNYLTHQEVCLMVDSIWKYLIRSTSVEKQTRFLTDYRETKLYYKDLKTQNAAFVSLFLYLVKTGYNFSSLQYEQVLELCLKFSKYDAVSTILELIKKNKIAFTSRLWVLKFQIMAETNPRGWNVNGDENPKNLSNKSWKSVLVGRASKETYLQEYFSEMDRVPDTLELHQNILTILSSGGQLDKVKDYIYHVWGIPSINQQDSVVGTLQNKGSVLYPTEEFLVTIISIFGRYHQLAEGLYYITKFADHYDMNLKTTGELWKTAFRWNEEQHRLVKDELFTQICALLDLYDVNFKHWIYEKKKHHCGKHLMAQELLDDSIKIYSSAVKKYHDVDFQLASKALTNHITCLFYINSLQQTDIVDEESLIERFALTRSHLDKLRSNQLKFNAKKKKRRLHFQKLQDELDDDYDEDSLW